jgi:crotonobetainyl-CoA:carnitine CoA-transferase CaiB-like acyl-CoA transferase
MTAAALAGVKAVELGRMVAGPYCGKLLADMGADVIKVEPPGGDPARRAGPFPTDEADPERSALFLYANTSKRGVTLNLDSDAAAGALTRLIGWADVLIDNLPVKRLENLGFGWDAVSRLNPGLIYVSITPYGCSGPRADVKGDELTLIHAGGLGNLMPTRAEDVNRAPIKMGGSAVGFHGGLTAAVVAAASLVGRARTGRGRLIDLSLQEAILSMVRTGVPGGRYQGTRWNRVPDRPPSMGRMPTKDGYVVVGTPENHHFIAFRDLMGNPEWIAGEQWESLAYRSHHLMEVADKLDEWMSQQTKDDIHHRAAKKGIAMGPINTARDIPQDGQYVAREYFGDVEHPVAGSHSYAGWPYKHTATPAQASRPAPMLGQHNREVYCGELGYSPEELESLQRGGTV